VTTPRTTLLSETRLSTQQVWYVAYGSNMNLHRFNYYLEGGRPPAGLLTYPGCRDASQPQDSRPLNVPGQLYFALEALAWTGGMAFYDPDAGGETAARGYLITASQFSDILAQEMCLEPDADLELREVLTSGRAAFGPGCYQTVVCLDLLDGYPLLTMTAPWRMSEVEHEKPSAIYLRYIASGLVETHGWEIERVAAYLSSRPGAVGYWSPEEVVELIGDLDQLPVHSPPESIAT
jgi:hypothetical protein